MPGTRIGAGAEIAPGSAVMGKAKANQRFVNYIDDLIARVLAATADPKRTTTSSSSRAVT